MSMHLVGPYMTTTNTKKPKTKDKQLTKHDVWLLKKGLHPEQIKLKKTVDKNWKEEYNSSMRVNRDNYVSSGMSGNSMSCVDSSIMKNLHKEPEHVRKAIIEKSKRIAPLYSKGGYQYISDGADIHDLGKKK